MDGGSGSTGGSGAPTREELRKKMRDKIRAMRNARSGQTTQGLSAEINQTMTSKERRKAEKQVQSKSVDDILNEFGITSGDAKDKVVAAMRSGELTTLNDLVQFLAGLGGKMPANNDLYNSARGATAQPVLGAAAAAADVGEASTTPHVTGEARVPLRPPPSLARFSTATTSTPPEASES